MRRGLSQGGRWVFKKVVEGRKKAAGVPPTDQRSSLQSPGRRASPFPNLPQPDFGREQNPKRTRWSRLHPTPPGAGKGKIEGKGRETCHPRSAKAWGPGRSSRRGHRSSPFLPRGARLPRTPTPSPRPEALASRSSGRLRKREVCREGAGLRVPGPAGRRQRSTYREPACPPVPLGVWPLSASAAETAALGPPLPGRVSARGAGVGVSAGAGRGGGAVGRRGEEKKGGAGALRKGPPGRGAPSFSRFPANY